MENLPAEPALRNTGEIMNALNNLDIFGFDISREVTAVVTILSSPGDTCSR